MAADPYRDSIHIAADPEAVFHYFTNATALARWMGDRAEVDPRPGGQFTIYFADRRVKGRYLELDRPGGWSSPGAETAPAPSHPGPASWKSPSPHLTAARWWLSCTPACPTASSTGTPWAGATTWTASRRLPPAATWDLTPRPTRSSGEPTRPGPAAAVGVAFPVATAGGRPGHRLRAAQVTWS